MVVKTTPFYILLNIYYFKETNMALSNIGKTLEHFGIKDFKKNSYTILDKNTDNLVISGEASEDMFEKFEKIAFKNYSQNNNVKTYAHSNHIHRIEDSEVLHENSVEILDSNYSSTQAIEILANSNMNDKPLFLTDKKYKQELRKWIEPGKQDIITLYE